MSLSVKRMATSLREIDILNGMEQHDTLLHGVLKHVSAGD